MKTLVIGDIHGCFEELQDLLDRAGLAIGDALIALGDIVDRGPETPQVLDFFRQRPNARALMGNHERKHLRAARGELKLSLSQLITRQQAGEAYAEVVRWIGSFPTWLELPEAVLVHGYLEPGIALESQLETVLCGTMGGEKVLRSRYARPWYELYDGEKPVIAGHHDYRGDGQAFIYQDRVFGLDTGCVLGRTLTGLVLPGFTLVSVPSRGNHWRAVRRQYRQPRAAARPPRPRAGSVEWDGENLEKLAQIVAWATRESEQVLGRLRETPGFESLSPRRQAQAYAAEIGDAPWAALFHLARKGLLDLERARQVVNHTAQLAGIARQAGLGVES